VESPAARDSSDAQAPRRFGSLDVDLLFPVLLVVALNLPQLADRFVPINDTFYNFANFHIFYSELLFHGDLPRWLPYGSYGLQSHYEQIIALGPSNYLTGAIGWLLGATDVLRLFQLAAILDQVAFVFGVFLLSRRLLFSRATVRVLCVAAAGTSVWYAQQWWDLRIYYLLPLLLYCGIEFIETRRPAWFWLAGLTAVAWSVGNLPYLIPLWALLLLVTFGTIVADPRRLAWSLLRPSADQLLAVAFFAAAGVYLAFLLGSLDSVVLRAAERDAATGKIDVETFKTYGGRGNLVVVLNALLFGWPVHLPWGSGADNSVYIGLLPLLGLCLAVVYERSRVFLGLVAGTVLLVWLSFGGAFTSLAYYLPGLSYFRHIGLVFGLVKVLLLIAAGFGLERLWLMGPPRALHPLVWLLAPVFVLEFLANVPEAPRMTPKAWASIWGSHVFVRLFFYGAAVIACRRSPRHVLATALTLALIGDMALYQYAVLNRVPRLAKTDAAFLAATIAREPIYRAERGERPAEAAAAGEDSDTRLAFALATRPEIKETYSYVYQFSNFDPCRSRYRTDAQLTGVNRLLALEHIAGVPIDAVLGCGTPKLRLATNARIVRSDDEMEAELVHALRAGETLPTVVALPPGVAAPPSDAAADGAAGRIDVTRFTLGELVAEVDVRAAQGAWLVYADAIRPGWHASVDGEEKAVRAANVAFKAVRVPDGPHVVRLWFEASALAWALAGFGFVGAVALVGWMIVTLFGRSG